MVFIWMRGSLCGFLEIFDGGLGGGTGFGRYLFARRLIKGREGVDKRDLKGVCN